MRKPAWGLVAALMLCLGAGAARAGTYSVSWSGTAGGTCTICGTSVYGCSNASPQQLTARTFTDATPAQNLVTSVTVAVSGVACNGVTLTLTINGTVIGVPLSPANNCVCGATCSPAHTFTLTDPAGIPGWNYGGSNTLLLSEPSAGYYCGARATITTTETPVSPGLYVTPSAVNFSGQRVGTTSATTSVTLRNTTGAAVNIASGNVTGPFGLSGFTAPFTLDAGTTTSLGVSFSPVTLGSASGNLTLVSDAPNGPNTVLALSGTGTQPGINVNPNVVAFGNVLVGTTSAATTVTISNTGTDTLNVASVVSSGAPFTVSGITTPRAITPSTSATFQVSFSPSATGPAMGTVVVTSDSPTTPTITVSLTGTGVQPTIGVSASALAFGTQRVGTTSATQSVTLSNSGAGNLVISSASVTAPFSIPGFTTPRTVTPGGTTTLAVAYTPTVTGPSTGTVTLNSNAPTTPTVISLTGTGVQPQITVTPTSLAFGSLRVGTTSAPLSVVVSNPGSDALTLNTLTFTGTGAANYALVSPPALPAQVASGGSLTLEVTVTPSVRGARPATLAIGSNAATTALGVPLSATGIAPVLNVVPNTVVWTPVPVGSSATLSVMVSNTGDADLVISALPFSGTNPGDFSTAFTLPATVAPGASTPVPVVFAPLASGARAGVMTVTTNAPVTPSLAVALSGTGTQPQLAITPSQHDFGAVRVGQAPSTTFTLSNSGTAPLVVSAIAVTGAGAAAFQATGLSLPATLAPAETRALTVTFAPATSGAVAAAVELSSNDPGAPVRTVALAGEGLRPVVAAAPSAVDFQGQLVGRPSAPRALVLSNTGTAPLVVSALTLGGANAAEFALRTPPTLPATVAAGATLALSLVHTAGSLGPRAATLTVGSDDPTSPSLVVPLAAEGLGAVLTATPTSLDFGANRVGAAVAPRSVTLSNVSGETVTLLESARSGAGATAYQASSIAGPLAPGATKTLTVTFSASATGAFPGQLAVAADDATLPQVTIALSGSAYVTQVAVEPTSLDFGDVTVGSTSAAQTMTLVNTSGAPVSLAAVTPSSAEILLGTIDSGPLAAGERRAVQVSFAPSQEGARSGQVTVTVAGATQPEATLAVTARGIAGTATGGGTGTGGGTASGGGTGAGGGTGTGGGSATGGGTGTGGGDTGGGTGTGGGGDPVNAGGCGCSSPLSAAPLLFAALALARRRRRG